MTLRMAGLPAACVQSFDVPKGLRVQDAGPPQLQVASLWSFPL